ncbi:MAG: endonuclease III [bacterium]
MSNLESINPDKREKVKKIISTLQLRYGTTTRRDSPFYILISTLLSQRTKDETTDKVSTQLFLKYKTPDNFNKAPVKAIESLIKSIGFYRVKAQRIKEISNILITKFNSKVPNNFDDLVSLPGIGPKTANCVLFYGFGIPALAVDTHVHRISNRLGLVKTTKPEDTEKHLKPIIPQKYWGWINYALVSFGKEICRPIGPKCIGCNLTKICNYKKQQEKK